ncbi:MAG: FAD-dependent oxidoreductase [Clostridiales bacterium]|nr:FAD-dependent oxidoreductase [Clostridiales bacterium]
MRTIMKTDMAVVAAGLSGLAAAISAAENGLSVIAVEKASGTGGAANMGMGPLGIGTRQQKENAFNMTPGEAFRIHMNFVHWNADGRLVHDYYFKSASTIEWLEDMGVEFFPPITAYAVSERQRAYATAYPTGHCVKPEGGGMPGPRCAGTMIKRMTERALELGVKFLFQTPAKKILMEDGKAVGILAVDAEGNEIEIRSKAVVIATGGFGDNPKLIKERLGYEWGKDLFSFRIPGMTGDGIDMAWEVGAGHSNMMMELMYQCPDNMNVFTLDGAFRQPCLFVNRHGERFMNEDGAINSTFTGNAIVRQPGHVVVSVLDSKMVKYYKRNGVDFVDHVHGCDLFSHFEDAVSQAQAMGYEYLYCADTLEDLAEQAGLDVERFLNTVEEYNEMCEDRYDGLFEKDPQYMRPIEKGPFYALKYFAGAYGTLGGIRINYKTEVVTDEDEVIPGLYAVGSDACNIFGDCYPFTLGGNTMGFCLNTGRMAGEYAAEFIENI